MFSVRQKLIDMLKAQDRELNVTFIGQFVREFEDLGFKIVNDDKNIEDLQYHTGSDGFYFVSQDNARVFYNSSPDSFIGSNGYFDVTDTLPEETSNIQVVDLKSVNLEIKKIAPLLVCKTNYDDQKIKRNTDKNNSLRIIIDEAHNILSENSTREVESWKDYRLETFEEIIKEGRKFGVFLTIASQRPSDISPTIISQLHNYFIHKLMNDNDLKAINKAVSYLDKLSFDSISNLSTGCCFIAGQMTQFPLSVKVKLLDEDEQPQSETINLNKLWRAT